MRELTWSADRHDSGRVGMRGLSAGAARGPRRRCHPDQRQGRIRHSLHFTHTPAGFSDVLLRLPAGLLAGVEVVEGGRVVSQEAAGPGKVAVQLSEPTQGDDSLTLSYAFGHDRQRFDLPLVYPEQATAGECKVRLWNEPWAQAPTYRRSMGGVAP